MMQLNIQIFYGFPYNQFIFQINPPVIYDTILQTAQENLRPFPGDLTHVPLHGSQLHIRVPRQVPVIEADQRYIVRHL